MIDLARDTIGSQPILTIFLAIGIGYLVGQINFGGFSLGVAPSCSSAWRSAPSRRKHRSPGRSASPD